MGRMTRYGSFHPLYSQCHVLAHEWLPDIPGEDTYPPLPPRAPDPAILLVSPDGRAQFGKDAGTDMLADRRLRHSGVGIFGGGTSSY